MSVRPISSYDLDQAVRMLNNYREPIQEEMNLNATLATMAVQLESVSSELSFDQCFMMAIWIQLMTWRLADEGLLEIKQA